MSTVRVGGGVFHSESKPLTNRHKSERRLQPADVQTLITRTVSAVVLAKRPSPGAVAIGEMD